jgi:hypothetical protein
VTEQQRNESSAAHTLSGLRGWLLRRAERRLRDWLYGWWLYLTGRV